MKNNRVDQSDLTEPNAEKIICRQLSQLSASNSLLFTCRATFLRRNDMKNALVILLTRVMVIVDLESDSVIDIFMLEKLQSTSSKGNADNLFVFKIKNESESSEQVIFIKHKIYVKINHSLLFFSKNIKCRVELFNIFNN